MIIKPLLFLKELIFPKICFGCGRLGSYFCLSCAKKLPSAKDVCPYCKNASYFGLTHPGCQKKWGVDGLKSFFYYNDLVKKIIKNIKYQLVVEATKDFLQAIPPSKIEELFFYKKIAKDFILLPVPLHRKREKIRGFNQAEKIANFFAQIFNFSFNNKLILRIKETRPQAELKTPKERYKNILGAFSLAKNVKSNQIKEKKFIIVDDVWTTGATIKEIGRVLKKNGAAKVFGLTLARG